MTLGPSDRVSDAVEAGNGDDMVLPIPVDSRDLIVTLCSAVMEIEFFFFELSRIAAISFSAPLSVVSSSAYRSLKNTCLASISHTTMLRVKKACLI